MPKPIITQNIKANTQDNAHEPARKGANTKVPAPQKTPKRGPKPEKPYDDFPLFAHATARWAKKVKGKLHYFGVWSDPMAALAKWQEQRDDLMAGRRPRKNPDAVTVADVGNAFLNFKLAAVRTGELQKISFNLYHRICAQLVATFGKDRPIDDLRADDFMTLRELFAQAVGPHELTKRIQIVRSIFKYAFDAGMIDRPVRFGPAFKAPTMKTLRLLRASKPKRFLEPATIRKALDAATVPMRAMILLGVNCAFGNNDCASLTFDNVNLDAGWIDFPRPKTGINRRCPLWPETVKALRDAIAQRPEPRDKANRNLVFITKTGRTWTKYNDHGDGKGSRRCSIAQEFKRTMERIDAAVKGVGFYGLRHTFRTVADAVGDRPAVDRIMGHENGGDIAVSYVEFLDDARLTRVTDHVRAWLFGGAA